MSKKVIALMMAMVLLVAACGYAAAWEETWKINPKNGGTFKKSPTNHEMPDSGSFWKATYVAGSWSTSKAYI